MCEKSSANFSKSLDISIVLHTMILGTLEAQITEIAADGGVHHPGQGPEAVREAEDTVAGIIR